MKTRLYLAGPMTGLPEYNYPAFRAAATQLRAAGYLVSNPADGGVLDDWTWSDYMRRGLRELLGCDAVALLGGWATSRGARLEVKVATDLGLDVALVDVWLDRARPDDDDDASSAGDRDASTSGGTR